jgi:hypothetical protein
MGLVITPESELGKEIAKWNAPKRLGGMNCNGFEPFPQMVYRAVKLESGKVVCMDADPRTGEYFPGQQFRIVESAEQLGVAKGQGWCDTPAAAKVAFEREEQAAAQAAAEANHAALRMTPKAQAERTRRDASTDKHVTE